MFTEERAIWLHRHYRWLEDNLPKRQSPGRRSLVLPTNEFFPDPYRGDHGSAVALFERVKGLMGMSDWPCEFVQRLAVESEANASLGRAGVLGYTKANDPAGTFSVPERRRVVITYSTSDLRNQGGLVATLAHELCHYLLAAVRVEPPATWKELEPLTDLSAVVEGFGIFLCNSAFQFGQWATHDRQGWSSQRKGYLNEAELGFALAMYCVRTSFDPDTAAPLLKQNPQEVFCDALDYVAELEDKWRRQPPIGGVALTF